MKGSSIYTADAQPVSEVKKKAERYYMAPYKKSRDRKADTIERERKMWALKKKLKMHHPQASSRSFFSTKIPIIGENSHPITFVSCFILHPLRELGKLDRSWTLGHEDPP